MDQKELKLEILKLVYRKDLAPSASVEVAKILEAYVAGDQPELLSESPLKSAGSDLPQSGAGPALSGNQNGHKLPKAKR